MTKVSQNGLIARSIDFLFHRRNLEQKKHGARLGRKLRLENLEDRMLLAALPGSESADANALIAQGYCDAEMNIISSNIYVTTYEDKIDPSDGLVSLREAIKYVESQTKVLFGKAGTIELNPTLGQIQIDKSLTFDATYSGTITLDAVENGRIMSIAPTQGKIEVSLTNMRFTRGFGTSGGAIWVGGGATVSLTDCQLENNIGTDGGAVCLGGSGKLVARNTVWENNSASRGGAVSVGTSGILDVDACTFRDNSASEAGGALYIDSSLSQTRAVYVTNSLFEENGLTATTISSEGGGACMIVAGEVVFDGCDFLYNSSALRNGGAVRVGNNIQGLYVYDSHFEGNEGRNGGALSLSSAAYAQLDGVTLWDNVAAWQGGGIYNEGDCDLEGVTLEANTVKDDGDDGGGIFNKGKMIVSGSAVSANICLDSQGSGAGIRNDGTMFVHDTLISNNEAGIYGTGGGIRNTSGGSINMVNSTVANNIAAFGGGIENVGTLSLVSSIITNNQAVGDSGDGGGLYLEKGSSVTVVDSTLYGNTAGRYGGGVYTKGAISLTTSTITANQDCNLNAETSGLYEGLTATDPDYSAPVYDDKPETLYGNVTTIVQKDESVSLVLCDAEGNVLEGAIDFAVLAADSTPYSETFLIRNNGIDFVTFNAPVYSGLNLDNFTWDFSSQTVAPGGNVSLTITFAPVVTGVSTLCLSFMANGKSQLEVKVNGTVAPSFGTVSQKTPYLSAHSGSTTYTVVLNEEPASDVVVELIVPYGLTCNKTYLTFTKDDWNTPQSVHLTTDEEYLSAHQMSKLSVLHRIIPPFNDVFDEVFEPNCSLYTQKIANVEVSLTPYVIVQEGTATPVPLGYEKLDGHVPASIEATTKGIQGYDEYVILEVKTSHPTPKTASVWQINWGDDTYQTVPRLSNSVKFTHWYSQSGSYNISVYIEYVDGTAENSWFTIATYTVNPAASSVVQDESLAPSAEMAAAVDSVLKAGDISSPLGEVLPNEDDIVILSDAAVVNALDVQRTRSVYFSRLRLDSFFDGNLNLKKKRILS